MLSYTKKYLPFACFSLKQSVPHNPMLTWLESEKIDFLSKLYISYLEI